MPDKDLAIIVPSRGRPQNIDRVLRAWDETLAWHGADLFLVLDLDDPRLNDYQEVVMTPRPFYPPRMPQGVMHAGSPTMIEKLNATALALVDKYRYIGFMGDDHLPRSKNWDIHFVRALAGKPGVVYGNDLLQGRELATACVISSEIIKTAGYFAPPGLRHLYCDNAWMKMGEAAGKLVYLPETTIEHVHPNVEKSAWDETYSRGNSEENLVNDRIEFERWEATDLPALQEKLRRI